jgi:hypothetical protein
MHYHGNGVDLPRLLLYFSIVIRVGVDLLRHPMHYHGNGVDLLRHPMHYHGNGVDLLRHPMHYHGNGVDLLRHTMHYHGDGVDLPRHKDNTDRLYRAIFIEEE